MCWHNRYIVYFISLSILWASCTTSDSTELELALKDGKCELALDNLSKAASSSTYFFYKGLCEKRTANYEAAIASFHTSLDKNYKPRIPIYLNLAASYAALNQDTKAYDHLKLLIKTGYKNDQMLLMKEFDSIRDQAQFQSIIAQVQPSYGIWMSLFLFVSLQALFMAILLFFQKTQTHSKLLGILVLGFSIVLFSFTLYWSGYNMKFPYLNNLYHLLPYAAGPLFFFYIRGNCNHQIINRQDYLHFIPLLVIAILISPWVLNVYTGLSLNYIPTFLGNLAVNPYTKMISLGLYLLASFRLMHTSRNLESNYNTWLKYLFIGFAGYTLSMLTYYILIRFTFFNPAWDYGISFSLSFFIFLISFMGYLQPRIKAGESLQSIIQPTKYARSALPIHAEQAIIDALNIAMEKDHVFRNGKLRLEDLATAVQSNRHDVSMVINKNFDGNFFDFLNRYRINYIAQEMSLSENNHKTLIELAYSGGFNNKVSFNKAFKKFKGMTPSKYRKQVLINS